MPDQTIENPTGAFNPLQPIPPTTPGAWPGQAPGCRYVDFENTGAAAIQAGDWVQLDATGTTTHVFGIIRGVHGGTVARRVGIAADAIAVGAVGRVIVEGPAVAKGGAAGVTAGQLVVPSTVATDDGCLVAGATATTVVGVALVTAGAVAGTALPMWVMPQ
jgi:hypothetical protein